MVLVQLKQERENAWSHLRPHANDDQVFSGDLWTIDRR